jgi:hypothetical protein
VLVSNFYTIAIQEQGFAFRVEMTFRVQGKTSVQSKKVDRESH